MEFVSLCWIILLLYWVVKARGVKPIEKVHKKFSGFWVNAGRVFFILLFVVSLRFSPLLFASGQTQRLVGNAMTLSGLVIAIIARKTLADDWSGDIVLKKEHKLITTGVYAYVRHPIYTGILLMALGTFLVLTTVSMLVFFLVMLFFILYKLTEEEKLLMQHFPKEYPKYRKRSKALVPFLW